MGIYRRPVYTSPTLVVEFEMDRRGMAEIARGKELRASVKAIALRGRSYAQSISPARTGNYRRSFHVNMGTRLVSGMRRVAAILANTDPAAVAIEVGTARREDGSGGTPGHRVMQKTLVYLGGRAQSRLSAPTVRSDAPTRAVPTIAEFRERQRRRRRRDRRFRGRGGS